MFSFIYSWKVELVQGVGGKEFNDMNKLTPSRDAMCEYKTGIFKSLLLHNTQLKTLQALPTVLFVYS